MGFHYQTKLTLGIGGQAFIFYTSHTKPNKQKAAENESDDKLVKRICFRCLKAGLVKWLLFFCVEYASNRGNRAVSNLL